MTKNGKQNNSFTETKTMSTFLTMQKPKEMSSLLKVCSKNNEKDRMRHHQSCSFNSENEIPKRRLISPSLDFKWSSLLIRCWINFDILETFRCLIFSSSKEKLRIIME
eukprot:GDKJ01028747.1.p1 GENE.GDKJ01028747.1~~GDKJ01028747.1.p1  ORF type:complete len:108 (-),score=19.17 GDKJ01028747.1:387-710(-)